MFLGLGVSIYKTLFEPTTIIPCTPSRVTVRPHTDSVTCTGPCLAPLVVPTWSLAVTPWAPWRPVQITTGNRT